MGHYDLQIAKPDPSLAIRLRRSGAEHPRVAGVIGPIRISQPGLSMPLIVPFKVDQGSIANQVVATVHRYGREMFPAGIQYSRLFLAFAKRFMDRIYVDLPTNDDIPSIAEWLQHSNFPGSKKRYLENVAAKLFGGVTFSKYKPAELYHPKARIESFIKDECYSKPKHARAINAPDNVSQVLMGPVFHVIDQFMFGLHSKAQGNPSKRFFVKGTNPRDWPQELRKLFGENPVACTDFTSFEAHHRDVFAQVDHYWFEKFVSRLSGFDWLKVLVKKIMLGRHHMVFKDLMVQLDETLMSGLPWTSSSNGNTNLNICAFLCALTVIGPDVDKMVDWAVTHFCGKFEGDDGIMIDYGISSSTIQKLGVDLKIDHERDFSSAKFCQIVCDPVNLVVLKDPIATIQKLFVLPAKFKDSKPEKLNSLLRARAMSYLVNYSACPIIAEMCHWVIRRTQGCDVRKMGTALDSYHGALLNQALREKPWLKRATIQPETRNAMSRIFKIPESEQLRLECAFRECDGDELFVDLSTYATAEMVEHGSVFLRVKGFPLDTPRACVPACVQSIVDGGLRATLVKRRCLRENERWERFPFSPSMVPQQLRR